MARKSIAQQLAEILGKPKPIDDEQLDILTMVVDNVGERNVAGFYDAYVWYIKQLGESEKEADRYMVQHLARMQVHDVCPREVPTTWIMTLSRRIPDLNKRVQATVADIVYSAHNRD